VKCLCGKLIVIISTATATVPKTMFTVLSIERTVRISSIMARFHLLHAIGLLFYMTEENTSISPTISGIYNIIINYNYYVI